MTRSLKIRATLWAVLAAAASAGAPLLLGRSPGDLNGSSLVFTPQTFDFGTVSSGVLVRTRFDFVNEGKSPVRILSAHGSCGCVEAHVSESYIEPKGRGTIDAILITEGRQGPQTLGIRVRTDEGEGSGVRLALNGTIRVALRPRTPRVLLGSVAPGSEQTIEIAVEKLDPVPEVQVSCRGEGLSAEKLAEDAHGFTLRIAVKVPWKRGTQANGVRLTGGEGSTWIPVVWTVLSPFELSAESIEIAGGKGEVTAKPRWPGVSLASVDTRGFPLEVARDGDRIVLTLNGSPFDIPSGATVNLVAEPKSLGSVAIPVYVRMD